MTALSLLFTLAAIGISETAYLIRMRKAAEKPICPIGGDCTVVLSSKYNTMLGVHNDLLGMIFYIGMATLAALVVIGVGPLYYWNLFIVLGVLSGMIFSLRFIYIQGVILKAWCTWCLLSAFTIFTMGFILLLYNFDILL